MLSLFKNIETKVIKNSFYQSSLSLSDICMARASLLCVILCICGFRCKFICLHTQRHSIHALVTTTSVYLVDWFFVFVGPNVRQLYLSCLSKNRFMKISNIKNEKNVNIGNKLLNCQYSRYSYKQIYIDDCMGVCSFPLAIFSP